MVFLWFSHFPMASIAMYWHHQAGYFQWPGAEIQRQRALLGMSAARTLQAPENPEMFLGNPLKSLVNGEENLFWISIMKSKFTQIANNFLFDQLIEDVTRTSYSTWLKHVNVNIPPCLWVKHLALSENLWPSTLAQAAAMEAVPWIF